MRGWKKAAGRGWPAASCSNAPTDSCRSGSTASARPSRRRPRRAWRVDAGLLSKVCAALGLAPAQVQAALWLNNGPDWLALRLADAHTVLALEPDHAALKSLAKVGVVGPHPAGGECGFEVRAFAAPVGIPEDPVTGSLNASLAQWLIGEGIAPPRYVAAQGTRLQRAGRVHIERDGDTVWVGGNSASVVRGELQL
jgi:PhzF family phenazine biosynthesis protein